ncbi:MAG: thioredoxin [Dehalococcoidia bacterium]|nr:thioredoxin [Dehalococcoidia bacterium]
MTSPQAVAIEVSDATFAKEVLERSKQVPVVVDFWAPWCGPCRVLGPVIEQIASEHGNDVVLAKLNTDENPRTATEYRIQGIPAVKAFRDGKVVREFTGAQPEPQVRAFFSALVPTAVEKAAKQAAAMARAGDPGAEAALRQVLEKSPGNADAVVSLAQILIARGETAEAETLLERVVGDRRAKVLKHRLFLEQFARKHAQDDIPGEVRANPNDPRAHYRLGVLLASQERYEESLEALLTSLRLDRTFADGAARQATLAVFDILGLSSPLAREYQRQLSQVLF